MNPKRAGGGFTERMDADVIVIGAGAAGLAAARFLARRSIATIVVEARDRVGGRTLTLPASRPIAPAELGAEFIHGRGVETLALLREAGLAAVDTGGEWWGDASGELCREPDDFDAAAVLAPARNLKHDESVEKFLARLEIDRTGRARANAARAFVEGFEAADPANASVRAIADELTSGVDARSARPLGGYGPLFGALHDACIAAGVRVFRSMLVRKLAWKRNEVAAEVCTGGEPRNLHARAAIVTLPAGVLRHRGDDSEVRFDPPLPAHKQEALSLIETGEVVKVVLSFRSAFWERICEERYRGAGFFHAEHGAFPVYWTQLPVRAELVAAWAGGPKASALRGASIAERCELAARGFGTLLGAPELARSELIDAMTHDWSADPFARGAYSYALVGAGDARAVLGAPVEGALFFAGEATATDGQNGTVNGALHSGERAAAEVADAIA